MTAVTLSPLELLNYFNYYLKLSLSWLYISNFGYVWFQKNTGFLSRSSQTGVNREFTCGFGSCLFKLQIPQPLPRSLWFRSSSDRSPRSFWFRDQGVIFAHSPHPRGHWAMSGYNFGWHNLGVRVWQVVGRPEMQLNTIQCTEQPPQQRIMAPKCQACQG